MAGLVGHAFSGECLQQLSTGHTEDTGQTPQRHPCLHVDHPRARKLESFHPVCLTGGRWRPGYKGKSPAIVSSLPVSTCVSPSDGFGTLLRSGMGAVLGSQDAWMPNRAGAGSPTKPNISSSTTAAPL